MESTSMKKPFRAGHEAVALTYRFSMTKPKNAVQVEQNNDQDLDSDLLEICEPFGSA